MPHLTPAQKNVRGVSVIEVLLVVAMLSVVTGFLFATLFKKDRSEERTKTAVELANYIQKARLDSVKRGARDVKQMAQVKVFNHLLYSVAIDGDGDGNLDVPLVKGIPDQLGVQIEGPFPKTYIFDSLGQTVDTQNQRVPAPEVVLKNSSGASAIRLDESGKVVVGSVKR